MSHPANYHKGPGLRRHQPAQAAPAVPRYSISVLAFNRLDVTKPCIEAVMRHSQNFELILTDNGSTDGVGAYFDMLGKRFSKHVRVIRNPENLGFQEPHRRALELARGEFFVLLNNDAHVRGGWLTALAVPFSDPKVAIVGPAGNCSAIKDDFHGMRGALEYIEGSCLMIRTAVAREHGLFAPYLEFAYGEDADLSLRLREKGYAIRTVPIVVKHVGSATARNVPQAAEFQQRNHAVLRERWAHYLKVRTMGYPIILRRRGALGDVLLATPIIHALKAAKPLSPIVFLTDSPQVLERNPEIYAAVRAHEDPQALVVDLDMAYENAPGVPYLDAYSARAGVTLPDRRLRYFPSDGAAKRAEAQLAGLRTGPLCAVHPEPSWPGRTWPEDRWAQLVGILRSRGHRVVLVGGGPAGGLPADADFRGKLSIDETAALLGCCELFVGIDSFPLHLAQSQGVPVVGLFGMSSPGMVLTEGPSVGVQGDPAAVPCIGERHRSVGQTFMSCDGACMRAISVEMVLDGIHRALLGPASAVGAS